MKLHFFYCIAAGAAVFAFAAGATSAQDKPDEKLDAILKREAASTGEMAQVQRYCEKQMPALPVTQSPDQWAREAERLRIEVLERIVFRGHAAEWRRAKTKVVWLDTVEGGPGYRIKKLRYEALPGMWIPALLYEPEQLKGKIPAILNVNGHSREGKAYVPKQVRCINQAKRGMLALNLEWLGMGQLRTPGFDHGSMNQLDLCGSSGLAPFYLAMARGLDLLLALKHADPERVAVTGLSGGGWQTIFLSSLDTRVKLAVPVAGYSSYRTRTRHLKDLGDSEQTPNDLATLVDYTHLTAMMAPRPTLLIYNSKDNCCFESGYALGPLLASAHPAFCLYGAADSLRTHINYEPGTHNYERDNREALYRMLRDFFYPDDAAFNAREIPSDDEVKPAEELFVDLPAKNEDFNTLAMKLAGELPRSASLPTDKKAASAWQLEARKRLGKIVKAKQYDVVATEAAAETDDGVAVSYQRLQIGNDWELPAVILTPDGKKGTTLLITDTGRSGAGEETRELLSAGRRVVVFDSLGFGSPVLRESKGALFGLLLAAVGDRPVGLQASQTAAVARWAAEFFDGPVDLETSGPRTGLIGLITTALEPDAIGQVRLKGSLGSVKQAIEENWSARKMPEMFCYGLLQEFDILHLAALAAPRKVTFLAPGERVSQELDGLRAWYRTWGKEFDPLGRNSP